MPAANLKVAGAPRSGADPPRKDKRSLILDSAIRVFAQMGYHGARVSDIAREAGIAYGLVYHYFKNKEEILNTIFEERWTGFLEALEGIAEGRNPTQDKLVSIAALVLNAYRLRPEWVKVLVLEIQRSSRFAEPEQMRAVGRLFGSVARILRAGQEAGALRADLDPELASQAFIGALETMITGQVLGVTRLPAEADDAATDRGAVDAVVDLFLNGLKARTTR